MLRWLGLLLVLVGCSSEPSSPGNNGGQARACTPGSTQECVGPGACKGGQACAFDGSGWGPCECGGGGAGGTGGSNQTSSGAGGSEAGSGGSDAGGGGNPAGSGGGPAGSGGGGAGGSAGGSGGSGGGPNGSGCKEQGSGCQKCCDGLFPGVQQDFATDLVSCACFGPCTAECGDICSGADSGEVCNGCLNEKFQGGECGLDSCASASCKAFSACVLGCP